MIFPTYALNNLSDNEEASLDFLILSGSAPEAKEPIAIPHRTAYYGIGICIAGHAQISANLENYEIIPNCLIAMSPHIIKQWHKRSSDFLSFAVLFTKDFLLSQNEILCERFPYFESVARHIFLLTPENADTLKKSLTFIKEKHNSPSDYRDEITRALLTGLLYEVASIYKEYKSTLSITQTRSQVLAIDFKNLVYSHFLLQRNVSFYADLLFITPNHLTATIRETTGKTPGEWIAETVVLEACVLLQNPSLTIGQIATMLNFSDQSSFGKYFKNIKGLSPAAYRSS